MNDAGRVDALETAKDLMNKRREMSVGEWLLGLDLGGEYSVIGGCQEANRTYDDVQIDLHQLLLKG